MKTVFVTYAGDSSTRFDRQYYVEKHLPLVTAAWGPHGMQSIAAFFPAGTGKGRSRFACVSFAMTTRSPRRCTRLKPRPSWKTFRTSPTPSRGNCKPRR